MIRETTIESVYPLSTLLAKKGVKVTPIGETPVDKLMQVSSFTLPKQANIHGLDVPVEEQILEGSRKVGADGNVRHDVVMDELVEVVSKTVKGNLHVARNVVNPIIKEVMSDTEEYIRQSMDIRSTHVQIKPVFYNPIFDVPQLATMVDRFRETKFKKIDLAIGFPYPVDRESLYKLAKTNVSSFDDVLKEFCSDLSEEEIAYTFNSVFGVGPNQASELNEVVNQKSPNRTLLIHLFARNLLNEVPESISVGLPQYRSYMSDIVAQSGRMLLSIIGRRDVDEKRNALIRPYPSTRELGHRLITIEVNGDVYERWLEDGGTPETIFGAYVSDQNRSYKDLIDNKDRYEKEWVKKERILTTGARLEKFNDAVEGLRLAVAKQINEIDEEIVPMPREVLHGRLEKSVSELYGNFYDNLGEYARKVVCETMFPHTNSLQILCAIDNVSHDFPNIDVREAALLATIEVVSNWVGKLLHIEHVNPEG